MTNGHWKVVLSVQFQQDILLGYFIAGENNIQFILISEDENYYCELPFQLLISEAGEML